MSLLGLPTELLDDIILQVYSNGDLESMALSCKRNYDLSKPHLKQYNILRRQWNNVRVTKGRSILATLVAIARDPVVARLIRTLDLTLANESEGDYECTAICTPGHVGYVHNSEARSLVCMSVRSSLPLALAEQNADAWTRMILPDRTISRAGPVIIGQNVPGMIRHITRRDVVIHRTIFLLTLLPNLERLRLPKFWDCSESGQPAKWEQVLSAISHLASGDQGMLAPNRYLDAPLARLESLSPSQEIDDDGRCRVGLKGIASFLLLPGLRHVNIMKFMACEDEQMYTGIPFQWSSSPGASPGSAMSNVRALHFEGCCIDAVNIGRILERMPAVTSLKYSHHATWNGCGHNWDAGAFAAAVSHRCGAQLRQLSLTVHRRMGAVESGIFSLHEFMALEEVQLDLLMFAAPPPGSGLLSRARGVNPEADDEWNISDIPPLSQILPIGIERVSLIMHAGHGIEHGQSELSIVRKQLRTLKALFAADLKLSHPYLQQVILRHDGHAVDLGMHTIVGQSGRRTDVSLESQVARLLRGTGVVGVLIDDCHDAFESMPWENLDEFRNSSR
ncbi:hypothetical protein CKM354_000453200 [Cercospora kikuchii]|uniref:F-box domain-containing protein n=1 Tax=Cercospora kikuchii TaxID=84275 RepID=A0A9P3FFV3_9PEZI|nr:uncharacterized protein CKM354_000453200 [Cercospora kikuchii]GIZ41219.1 hypothetical protein CKM354_000453200 [Cercospora kikuchii]